MDKSKADRLESAGWRVGSVEEFLKLTPEESALVEIKLSLANRLRELRTAKNLVQSQLAASLGSSQSRVAKMEAGDPTVSIDLLLRALLLLGDTPRHVGATIAGQIRESPKTEYVGSTTAESRRVVSITSRERRFTPVARRSTSRSAASSASRVLRSRSTGKASKRAAGSALSQTRSRKTTGRKAGSAASKVLRDGRSSRASKAAAGSALSQRSRTGKGRKK